MIRNLNFGAEPDASYLPHRSRQSRIPCTAIASAAYVIHPDGSCAGFQNQVQLDPSDDNVYHPGSTRHIFTSNALTFDIVICQEDHLRRSESLPPRESRLVGSPTASL
jgi:hypothetical protein